MMITNAGFIFSVLVLGEKINPCAFCRTPQTMVKKYRKGMHVAVGERVEFKNGAHAVMQADGKFRFVKKRASTPQVRKRRTECSDMLGRKIGANLKGKFKSRSQAIAVAYRQTEKKLPHCKTKFEARRRSRKRSKSRKRSRKRSKTRKRRRS